jgi:hypothetical protein
MRKEYRQSYDRLVDERSASERRLYPTRSLADETEGYLAKIRNRVQRGIGKADLNLQLRPDTEYALIVCFEDLIALPFYRSRWESEDYDLSDEDLKYSLLQYVEDDTVQILQSAEENVLAMELEIEGNDLDERELTAGDVMRTISDVYDKLRSVDIDVWG